MRIDKKFIQNMDVGELVNFDSYVQGFSIDSRKIKENMGFVALPGQSTDGHNYLDEAYQKGASLLIVSEAWYQDNQVSALPLLITSDPEEALQKIAKAYRKYFNHPVLCITGSNGKTTTLEMIKNILGNKYNVHSTIGNYNNQLGVPISVLSHKDEHTFSVLELGTNHFGEIEFLSKIAQPTAGLITNIGAGHVEFLKNKEGVARAKSELFTSLPKEGIAFVNSDDRYIARMPKPENIVSFGYKNNPDYKGKVININNKARYKIEINKEHIIQLPVAGESFAKNALAAFAVGAYYQVPPEKIISSLEGFDAVHSRLKIIRKEYTIIDDSYNANPDSTKAAINTLEDMNAEGKKIFVFGDMLELGDKSEEYHREIGEYAASKNISLIFTYGELSIYCSEAARKQGCQTSHFSSKDKLIKDLEDNIEKKDIILIKGSRGNHMEEIVKEIS